MNPLVPPLSYRHRNLFFYLLLGIFVAALPFLILYASGYRFYLGERSFISTGGLYIAAERTGAEIYIDNELMRETRVFRRAFYAQGLETGTHRVHVQKTGHHTWVKELPVYPHLVTEAQAFNLPLRPDVRLITPYTTPAGVAVITASSSALQAADVLNPVLLEPQAATSSLVRNPEFMAILQNFTSTSTATSTVVVSEPGQRLATTTATATLPIATTTKETRSVRLLEEGGKIYARYIGQPGSMPYYYCAEPFLPYTASTTAGSISGRGLAAVAEASVMIESEVVPLETQSAAERPDCDPIIAMDTFGEYISHFDFFPGSSDLVILAAESGVYVEEIDDRAWQNRQPLLVGSGLEMRVIGGSIYLYDGKLIYQVEIAPTWF